MTDTTDNKQLVKIETFITKSSSMFDQQKVVLANRYAKIKDLQDDTTLKQTMKFIFVEIGFCEKISFIEQTVLENGIKQMFGGYTCAELKLAVDLIISGVIGNIDDLNLYGKVPSLLYFGKIMNIFSEYRNNAMHEHRKKLENKVVVLTPEQKAKINYDKMKVYCIKAWKDYKKARKKGEEFEVADMFGVKFDFLSKLKVINLPESNKKMFLKQAEEKIKAENETLPIAKRVAYKIQGNYTDVAIKRAKEMCLQYCFDYAFKNKIDIVATIEKAEQDLKK